MVGFNIVNDRTAVAAIKTRLQALLTDPRAQYEPNKSRNWVHTDKPLTSATYPRIQVKKRGPSASEILCIGRDFIEQRILIVDIQFWTSTPFKWKDGSNDYHQDEELVKYNLEEIWDNLKDDQSTLYDTYGITGLKMIGEEEPYLEPDTQLYTGITSIRIWYFRK